MKKSIRAVTPGEKKIRKSAWITVICDSVLLVVFVACLLFYININNNRTYTQNVENISSIAESNSDLLQAQLDSTSYEVKRAYNYCKGKSVAEILDYLSVINDTDEEYQLLKYVDDISTDVYHVYSGFSSKKLNGEYQKIEYKNTSLAAFIYNYAAENDGEIAFSQSFTNTIDALRYFAVFCRISVLGEPTEQYYLVRPKKENVVIDVARRNSQYTNLSIAICYTNGKYLAYDNSFRSDNFFDYIYKYNGLSLDQRNELSASVKEDSNGKGVLTYKDYQKRDCVFVYSVCRYNSDWLVIVSVPVSEFMAEKPLSTFPVIIISFLSVLLLFNIYRLLIIVGALRDSVIREQIANASKSSFLSCMSHEIRTPLNAIIGYNTIAKNELKSKDSKKSHKQVELKVSDCLAKSEMASKHLMTVINDVLDMSAIESGKIKIVSERFDFGSLITSLTTVFYSQAKAKNVNFEVVFDTLTEEWFVGDQMRISQILTNLLSNAVKFTPEGGSVVLKINQPDAEENAAHIHFEVTDTGIGMSEEYLKNIWAPFEQADSTISRRFGGSGLGLSITKNLVDLMGGTISVTSSPGNGSSFFVDLTFERTEQPKNPTVDFRNINALVVDDDYSACDYVRLLLNRFGAKCVIATNCEDALKAVRTQNMRDDPFSICIVDWRMPDTDGVETIKQIKELSGEQTPVIVITAYDYSEISDVVSKISHSQFLSKPFFQSTLFDTLTNIFAVTDNNAIKDVGDIDFGGAHILLAEDNSMNMEIATTILQYVNLVVDTANNGREALDMFIASEPGYYKAILMDVHMPEMDGHEATKAIRKLEREDARDIPILAMTADAFSENIAEAYSSGMNEHIAKPIDVKLLYKILKIYIKGGA